MNYQNNPTNSTGYIGGNTFSVGTAFPTVSISPLDEVAKALESAHLNIESNVSRLRQIADSLFGAQPEDRESGGIAPQRPGRLGGLNDQADRVNWALSNLDQQVSRFGSLG